MPMSQSHTEMGKEIRAYGLLSTNSAKRNLPNVEGTRVLQIPIRNSAGHVPLKNSSVLPINVITTT